MANKKQEEVIEPQTKEDIVVKQQEPKKKDKKLSGQAVVIALKTRTIPVKKAVKESIKALNWLKNANCKKIIFKYCSTFDSTKKGNIGPVIDALMKNLKSDFTIACPSFPDAGRSLYFGHMFAVYSSYF